MSDPLTHYADRIHSRIRSGSVFEPFEEWALELFRLQLHFNEAYRRWVAVTGVDVDRVRTLADIPAVPTIGFKALELTSLAPSQRTRVFHSSGTTGQEPSRHVHGKASLALYEASAIAGFERGFWRSGQPPAGGWHAVSLTPPAAQVPHSSLVHMIECVGRGAVGERAMFTGRVGVASGWEVDGGRVMEQLRGAVGTGQPVVVFGTAFNFVHLIEDWDRSGVRLGMALPPGSQVLETGGYKGRSREWTRDELRGAICRVLGIGADAIVGEYGMSELSSQAYERTWAGEGVGVGGWGEGAEGWVFSPWARAVVIAPETGREAGDGEPGLLRILDLANVWSVMAIQTEDRAVRCDGRLILLGRAPAAEPRGCSLMAV